MLGLVPWAESSEDSPLMYQKPLLNSVIFARFLPQRIQKALLILKKGTISRLVAV